MEYVVVVEDERKINDLIRDYLGSLGYRTAQAFDGPGALALLDSAKADLVVLDLMLPGLDGIEVLRRLRARGDHVPVIMLTARDSEGDKLLGLEVGADDYMTKPFSVRELGARIKAVLRRGKSAPQDAGDHKVLDRHGVVLDASRRSVRKNGSDVRLTSAQFDLLMMLMQDPGRVFTRQELIEHISGYAYEGYERTVDVQVKNIRKVLEDDPANPVLVQTVWGVGYRFRDMP